ncbi:MAG: hypothetical protein ACR2NH_05000 [Solirubrobacteraceae bacterium]
MQRSIRGALASVVLVLVAAAPAAAAPGPAVSVRIEGENGTLVARTTVQTSTDPVPGNNCSGTSVAGVIEKASNGNWDRGPNFTQTILGETHDFTPNDFWSTWRNLKPTAGICDEQVNEGDDVLIQFSTAGPPNYAPDHWPVVLTVPAVAETGQAVPVRVQESQPDEFGSRGVGTLVPGAGFTVSGGGASAVTGSDGTATMTLPVTGTAALRATKDGRGRSATEAVCVHVAGDGLCNTPVPPAPPVVRPLTVLPLAGITAGQRFVLSRAPRLLRGKIDPGTEGLIQVRLRLRRTVGARCSFYSLVRERFLARRCAAGGFSYLLGSRADWSYLLPFRLPPGRYDLTVRAVARFGRVVRRDVSFTVYANR